MTLRGLQFAVSRHCQALGERPSLRAWLRRARTFYELAPSTGHWRRA